MSCHENSGNSRLLHRRGGSGARVSEELVSAIKEKYGACLAPPGEVRPLQGGPGPGRVMVRQAILTSTTVAMGVVLQEEAMTEMEMLKELRNVVASVAGQAGGNREAVKAGIRQELVDAVREKFGLGTWSSSQLT